jgi:type IV pilus assembly protein PilC
MITYSYKAKKDNTQTVSGEITAHNQEEAIELINQLGLLPILVKEHKLNKAKVRTKRKVKSKDLYFFSRQLANLLRSGMTLVRALTVLENQTANQYFQAVIHQVTIDVKNGKAFSKCLEGFPRIFPSLYVSMVQAGEESGNLEQMLINVSQYYKKQEEIFNKVRAAIIYPALMAVVGALTVYFILTFVLPKMSALFKNIGDALPLPTVILLQISNFLGTYWIGILVVILFSIFILGQWKDSKKGKISFSQFILKLPLFGDILLKTELARFAQTSVLLIKSDVNILKSLEIAISTVDNEIIKRELLSSKMQLETGGSFGGSIQQSKHLPVMMGHLIAVGEESDSLPDVLTEIANNFEQETDELIKLVTTLLEPVLILSIGLIVGFIVFAMLLPIFEFNVLSA